MHVYKLQPGQSRCCQHGASNRIRDVVEFQIKENVRAEFRDLPDRFRSGGRKELAADLKHADKISELPSKSQCRGQGIEVQRYDQAASWMGVKGQGRGRARSLSVLACVVSSSLRRQLHQFQPHLADSRVDQANLPGYAIGYINFASFLIRTPVINTNNLKFAIADVYYAHPGSERKVRVGGRQALSVKPLAVRGLLPVKVGAIPTGISNPYLDRLYRLALQSHQGCFHRGRNQEHQRHPAYRGPCYKEWSSHSVFNPLQMLKKCIQKTALCQLFSLKKLPLNSLKVHILASIKAFAKPPAIASLAFGSEKLAVPTCTAVAPTLTYSMASATVSTPPRPRIGMSTTLLTSQTSRRVIGLIAGPERPPVRFPKRDFWVLKSIAIAGKVLATVRASAPARSAVLAISPMSVTRGISFTQSGLFCAAFRAAPTTSSTRAGSLPNCIPPFLTFGQEMLSS